MDKKSLHTLEFDKILEILAGYASFSAGEALARSLQPTADPWEAALWQEETAEARRLLETNPNVTIGGAQDVRPACDNADRGFVLPAEDLLDIRSTIIAARNLKRVLLKAAAEFPRLAAIGGLIEECPGLVTAVSQTIDDRGEVLDSASPKLAKIRGEMRVVHGRIQDKLQKLLNSSQNQYLQEPIITRRSGRYVVPLRADAKGRIKGIVHDQSGTGATLWVEPLHTVELNNEFRSLQIQEQDEINRALKELSAKVAAQSDSIRRVVERLAELDLIFARARYAAVLNGVPPEFVEWRDFLTLPQGDETARNEIVTSAQDHTAPSRPYPSSPHPSSPHPLHPGSTVWIKGARHPLLPPDEVVSIDLTVPEDVFTVLITGPNTGGKTVSLKTMGLMALMAQSGMQLPAVEARLTIFDNVFADIGDEQSIEQSLSTFSAHITNIIRILERVDDRSLVLLDELGSGTDPAEGAALAQAIISYLRDKGATSFIATHYPELKFYADQQPGATNASLTFDVDTLAPTYEMAIGIPGKSNALSIARRLGLDETILDEAMRLNGRGGNEAEALLDSIYDLREKIAAEEAAARLALRQVEAEKDALARRLEQIEEERAQILAAAQAEAQEKITAVEEELRRARRQIRDAQSLNKLKKVGKDVARLEAATAVALTPPRPKTPPRKKPALQVGDRVRIKTLNTDGEVVSLGKKEALVVVGRAQMRVKLPDLVFKSRPAAEETAVAHVSRAASPGLELDIRGRRVEDGLAEMESFLDRAYLSQMPWVRIIHGKGTGRLRAAVRQALKQNPHVTSWEEGKDGEGGAGVTVVKFAA